MTIKQFIIQLLDFRLHAKIKYIHFEIDEKGEERFEMEVFGERKVKRSKEKEDNEEGFI